MASALKSTNMLDPEFIGGFGSEYADKYATAKEAEQRLMELLQQRSQRSLSNPMLALAGEMLDPGRTGSFGEALGRGLKSYSTAREAEEKDLRENAMLQMQLAQMGASQALKRQAMSDLSGMMRPGAGAPSEGGEPGAGPAMTIRGMQVNPAIIARMKMIDKDLGEALETEYKLRLESIAPGQGYILRKDTGKAEEIPGAEMKDEYVPEIKGSIKMSMADAAAIRDARNKGDANAVYKMIDKYQLGVGPRPAPTEPAPAEVEAPKPAGTIEEREVEKAREKEVATTLAKERAERTSKFLGSADEARLSRAAAAENIQILSRNPKIVGYLNKPGVGNAMWQVIQDSLRAHSASGQPGVEVNVQKTDLESALQKVDPDFKLSDFTDLSIIASNIARMELGLRKATYAGSGMGAVSNMEGQPIKDILGNRYDTADALIKKMMLAGRSFDFDMDVAAAYRKWNQKHGGNKTLEDFKSTKEYSALSDGFEKWLSTNLKIPYRKRGAEGYTPSTNSILDEVQRRKGKKQ